MREFPSCQDYRNFATSVTRRSRYVFESHVEEFLGTVIETGARRIGTIEAGSILYRAQLGHEWESHPVDPNDVDGERVEVPGRVQSVQDEASQEFRA